MNRNRKGFTIIEVVLVLAIAGLIFLMVFIALPALQRSQRNTRRRQDMSRILSAFVNYQTNNGHMPEDNDELSDLVSRYIISGNPEGEEPTNGWNAPGTTTDSGPCFSDEFCDPDGSSYRIPTNGGSYVYTGSHDDLEELKHSDGATNEFEDWQKGHNILYRIHAKCGNNEGVTDSSDGHDSISIEYVLEGGAIYCADNQ